MMEWFKKHKVLTVILIFIAIGGIGSVGSNNSQKTDTNPNPDSIIKKEDSPKLNLADFYSNVQTGMTKDEVLALTNGDSGKCSASEIQGFGSSELCNWYGSFGDKGFVTVTFSDNKVSSKSKYGF